MAIQDLISDIIATPPIVRQAVAADIPILKALLEESVRGLNIQNYTPQQLESALAYIFGIDHALIVDGTYYVAEIEGEIVGCGGWSQHNALYGGAQVLRPAKSATRDAAQIRAMFVDPDYARRGVGTRLMQVSELAARRAGFRQLELIATLTGEPLYRKCGFVVVENLDLLMPDGHTLQAVRMIKQLT